MISSYKTCVQKACGFGQPASCMDEGTSCKDMLFAKLHLFGRESMSHSASSSVTSNPSVLWTDYEFFNRMLQFYHGQVCAKMIVGVCTHTSVYAEKLQIVYDGIEGNGAIRFLASVAFRCRTLIVPPRHITTTPNDVCNAIDDTLTRYTALHSKDNTCMRSETRDFIAKINLRMPFIFDHCTTGFHAMPLIAGLFEVCVQLCQADEIADVEMANGSSGRPFEPSVSISFLWVALNRQYVFRVLLHDKQQDVLIRAKNKKIKYTHISKLFETCYKQHIMSTNAASASHVAAAAAAASTAASSSDVALTPPGGAPLK